MKRILLFASALAGLFAAASCQQENLEPEVKGGVTYEITLPGGPQTKGENGYDTYDLHYEVYRVNGTILDKLYHEKVVMEENTINLPLDLLNDQTYTVIFWAQEQGTPWIDASDLQKIKLNESVSNNDHRDAFCAVDANFSHDGAEARKVTLTRPFAQVNIATTVNNVGYDITPKKSLVTFRNIPTGYNLLKGETNATTEVTFGLNGIPGNAITVNGTSYTTVAMNYVLVADSNIDEVYYEIETNNGTVKNTIPSVPVKKNYRTNIIGNLLTSNATYTIELKPGFEEGEYTVEDGGNTSVKVTNTAEFTEAFADANMDVIVLGADINLNDLETRAATDPTFTVERGKTLTIDLGGHKLSATSAQTGKNYNMLNVNGGTLTVTNGTIEYEHLGENMGWNSSTNIFNVTAGGVLNLEGVTAKNLGGSDMGFVAHLNNWGEVTLNAENCTLESNYVPVRVFNSGYDMNNVTIKNSTLKGGSAAFWVHNYTVEDFGSAEKAEAQKALLNLSIYDQGNTFSPDVNGVRYGFTNSVRSDAYGITKTVSEDGTEVTLGSVVENGLIRRGVAGAEENTTITKVVVEEGVTTLYDRTFRRFYALETVELPNGLTTIGATGSGVFQSCTALKNIVIPETVNVLGKGTFQECSSLESINIPAGVTRIEADALRATGLVSVEFHEGVTYFGAQAFRDCKQLKEVVIKAPKFTVEANAFGVMSGALPGTTIYVANTEMKAYLESTLSYKNQFKIVVPGLVEDADEFKAALADASKDIITLAAGTYDLDEIVYINHPVTLVADNPANKPLVKGKIVANADFVANNIKFEANAVTKNNLDKGVYGTYVIDNYSAIVTVNRTGATFDGCEFNGGDDYTVAVNYFQEAAGKVMNITNCKFVHTYIYSKVLCNVSGNTFDLGECPYSICVWPCPAGSTNNECTFVNNKVTSEFSAGKAYCQVMLLSQTAPYANVVFNVKDNEGEFVYLWGWANSARCATDGSVTFAEGSKKFNITEDGKMN